ncbi:MAG: RNA methyltransferase [Bacteroidales bacterium]|jgi:23S rRNA (guanosine2251-2'-O)-methyltransferase|nr:RNA methyltransferase [Bacteroidales bacterium]
MRKLNTEEIPRLSPEAFKTLKKYPVCIVLDNIRSHHNVGSFFRTADAFRFESILLCGITGTPPHRDIRKTALGASETVNWTYHEDSLQAVKTLKSEGYYLISIEITENSTSMESFSLPMEKPIALIFGNEVKGVSQEIINLCNMVLEIPQEGTKHSLNVSISGGICMWEIYKKLRVK